MTPEQKATLAGRHVMAALKAQSELRIEYAALESVEERAAMEPKFAEAEKVLMEAIDAQVKLADSLPDPGPIGDADREVREFDEIYHQASLAKMVIAVDQGKAFDGPEKEVREAFLPEGGRRENTVPLAMLLQDDERLEIRRDPGTATVVDPNTGRRMTFPIAQRVFGESEGAYMGARFISVPGGQQDFPFISGGATPQVADENEDIEAEAGTIAVVSSNPKEVGAAYLWGLTTQLRFAPGELESALRADARAVIGDYMDQTIVQGQAATANTAATIDGLLSIGYDDLSSSVPGANVTCLEMLQFGGAHVDAIWANTDDGVRYLVTPQIWQRTAYLQLHAMSDRLLKDMLRGRFRASHHIAEGAAAGNPMVRTSDFLTYAPERDMGELIVPTWQDVLVTFDIVTHARARQRRLSLDTAYDVIIRRGNPWRRQRVQVPAA